MDNTLPTFLTNPDQVGELTPFYLKYPEGATLFIKNAEGAMVDSTRKTQAPGIITLSKVPVVKKDGQPTHYQIRPEGGYLAAADIQKLSQYALEELGFVTLDKAPESFDLIDGVRHPNNVVKGILEQMYKAAEAETRISHILNKYNYKRLLDKIDSNQDGHYSEQEYLQAIHNDSPSYRDHLYRIIARHGSEWYYGKDDPLWKKYLDTLTIDAPLWKTYTEAFIDKITWMKQVPGMGPELWHLHPVVFLGAFSETRFPQTPVDEQLTPLDFLTFYNGEVIDDNDFELAATKLSCEVAAIKAVAQSETGNSGSYFKFQRDDDYVPAILFERHHFHKYTNGIYDSYSDISNESAGGYGRYSEQYPKLLRAYALNKKAALMSASWGKFQILASNYQSAGYSSPEEFVMSMSVSEKNQLNAFVNFIMSDAILLRAIRNKDWLGFALRYNGPGQRGYDRKMRDNYELNR